MSTHIDKRSGEENKSNESLSHTWVSVPHAHQLWIHESGVHMTTYVLSPRNISVWKIGFRKYKNRCFLFTTREKKREVNDLLSRNPLTHPGYSREELFWKIRTQNHIFPSQMGVDYYFLQQSKLKKTITKKRFTSRGASRNVGKEFRKKKRNPVQKLQLSWHSNDEQRSQPQFRKRI